MIRESRFYRVGCGVVLLMVGVLAESAVGQEAGLSDGDPLLALMMKAAVHAKAHGDEYIPAVSPLYTTLLGEIPSINVARLQKAGFLVCHGRSTILTSSPRLLYSDFVPSNLRSTEMPILK